MSIIQQKNVKFKSNRRIRKIFYPHIADTDYFCKNFIVFNGFCFYKRIFLCYNVE